MKTSKKSSGKKIDKCEIDIFPCCSNLNLTEPLPGPFNELSGVVCDERNCNDLSCGHYCHIDKLCADKVNMLPRTRKCCECNYCRSDIGLKLIVLIIVFSTIIINIFTVHLISIFH